MADLAVDPKLADSGEASGKILHYMACGLPVACFVHTNNRKYLGERGYYAEPVSGDGLAAAIEKGLADPEASIQRGKIGRHTIQKERTLLASGGLLKKTYKSLLPAQESTTWDSPRNR